MTQPDDKGASEDKDASEDKGTSEPMTWPVLCKKMEGKWAEFFEEKVPELRMAVANAPEHVPCPVHGGGNGYRLFEHFNVTGRGICNTCGPQKSGFATLAWVRTSTMRHYAFKDAVREVAQWLRCEDVRPPRPERPPLVLPPRMDPMLAYRRIAAAWRESTPLAGTAAERYLRMRGIWPENLPSTLRAHPGLSYYDAKLKKSLGIFPCLLAPVKDANGTLVTLHRIFLTPEGMKADVPDPKRMMAVCGELRGAAIRLFRAEETLGFAEGIETALAAHAMSRMPVWSCVTAGLMEIVWIPECVKHVVIWADLDVSGRGLQAADALADKVEASGRTVEICIPQGPIPVGEKSVDWLDVLTKRGVTGFPAKWRRWRAVPLLESTLDLVATS